MKAATKKFDEKREKAGPEEMEQLHEREAFVPVDWKTSTHEQKKMALESLTFIKEKRCGGLKGRTHADGRKQ